MTISCILYLFAYADVRVHKVSNQRSFDYFGLHRRKTGNITSKALKMDYDLSDADGQEQNERNRQANVTLG